MCVAGLRGHRVPANLFLIHNLVSTLILWSLDRITWSDWKWGCFKIFFGTCDLTFTLFITFCFGVVVLGAMI